MMKRIRTGRNARFDSFVMSYPLYPTAAIFAPFARESPNFRFHGRSIEYSVYIGLFAY